MKNLYKNFIDLLIFTPLTDLTTFQIILKYFFMITISTSLVILILGLVTIDIWI